MELSGDDCGSRRSLQSGEDLTIVLPETATTGYRWHLDSTDDFQEINTNTAGDLPGAPGTRTFRLTPCRTGLLHLRLVKRRRWEQAIVEECTITLVVWRPL